MKFRGLAFSGASRLVLQATSSAHSIPRFPHVLRFEFCHIVLIRFISYISSCSDLDLPQPYAVSDH